MLAAVIGVVALYQVNTQIRKHILKELQNRFPEIEIDIGKVHLNEHRGISIRHLECSLPARPGCPKRALLAVDEVYLECPVSIQTLYRQKVRIDRIVLRTPIVRLSRNADGRFEEILRLKPNQSSETMAPVEVYNGIVLYEDLLVSPNEPVKFTGIDLKITPPEKEKTPELLSDLEKKGPPPGAWQIEGGAKGDLFRQMDFEGHFNPETGDWEASATCRQFDWTAEFLQYLRWKIPASANTNLRKTLNSFQGRFDFALTARRDPEAPLGARFQLDGILSQGRAELYEIDRTLSELNTRFQITDRGFVIEKLTGIAEAARLVLSYSQTGLPKPETATLSTNIRGLAFDGKFVEALAPILNESTKKLLKRYEYAGTTDLDTQLVFQNGRWQPRSLDLKISELSFTYLEFPYKVERLSGDFKVDHTAKLEFHLVGRHDDPLKTEITGRYENVFADPVGQVVVRGQNVPIDAKLMNTIPEEQREIIQSLHPAGKINAMLLIKLPPDDLPLEKHFEIGMNNVSVRYDKFPYPLREIQGLLVMKDEEWEFRNIVGTNESAHVTGAGHLKPVVIPGERPGSEIRTTEFQLVINAKELPLDGQLPEALLDEDQKELLTGLRVHGKINLAARIRFWTHDHRLNLEFQADPCPGLSMHPTRFPYRIDNIQGQFHYENGVIYSKRLTGNNRDAKLSAGVLCQFSSDGRWMMRFDPLVIDQLTPNRELADALPTNFQKIFNDLQITKPLNIKGLVEFSKSDEKAPFQSVWDLGVVLHQNGADLGVPIQNIFGQIRLIGYSLDDAFRLAGELQLDSATVRGFQLTDLAGPFFYDGVSKEFYAGYPAGKMLAPPPDISLFQEFRKASWFTGSRQANPIRGKLFDGTLICEGLVVTRNSVSYSVNTHLIGADLAKIAREIEPTAQKMAGKLNLQTHLHGEGRKMETLGGRGSVQLRDANIYEAPGMVRLLRELSIREIDSNAGAFSKADVNFVVQGNRLILNPISFEGGAFSLIGDGEMKMDTRNMNLSMKTRLGNRRTQIPIVSEIIGGAGDQIIQLKIHGPISDPTITRVVVPGIQNVLQTIQGEETAEPGQTPPQSKPAKPTQGPARLFPWR